MGDGLDEFGLSKAVRASPVAFGEFGTLPDLVEDDPVAVVDESGAKLPNAYFPPDQTDDTIWPSPFDW